MSDTSLTVVNEITPQEFKAKHEALVKFVKGQLKESTNIAGGTSGDYGVIPYTKTKALLKPGAEKLLKLFGFSAKLELVDKVEDWEKGFLFYRYKCTVTHIASGAFIADATRSCTNKEKKHASKGVYDAANTIEAIAQKRALVAATVQATMASEIFDADVSDSEDVAPNKTVTKDEDPRRLKVMGAYFAAADSRGFTQEQAKGAAHRKLEIESLKEATTGQIEELTSELISTFRVVGAGEKPQKLASKEEVVEAEIVIEDEIYYCRGPKHLGKDPVKTTVEDPWCGPECEKDYWGDKKPKGNVRYEEFVASGGKSLNK